MFIFIGAAPGTEMLAGFIDRDEQGFILTGPDLGARDAAAGLAARARPVDVRDQRARSLRRRRRAAGSSKRVAAAVGEGSGAVGVVHRYLETV